ncbi:TPA: late control D family protein [Escherichia coli]|nr:late control D family protein [Escherichia coli]
MPFNFSVWVRKTSRWPVCFKRVIDEQDWTITKVTHFLNNSGFTTSLELEVRLSDVEYETEDDE